MRQLSGHPLPDLWLYNTESIRLTCLPCTEMTGKPICLVQVDMTSSTGLPLAASRDAHRSSTNQITNVHYTEQ